MLALILVIVLLATRSANGFFRPVPMPVRTVPAAAPPGTPAPVPAADLRAQLSTMERQHQRGELTAEELDEARRRLLG
jgi:hypothetical protein